MGHACLCHASFLLLDLLFDFQGALSLCRYDNQLLQLTVSCLYLSAMVGAFGSELSRPLGRKASSSVHPHAS